MDPLFIASHNSHESVTGNPENITAMFRKISPAEGTGSPAGGTKKANSQLMTEAM